MERIALHRMEYLGEPARVSTVRLGAGVYETLVMWDDGEEIEPPARTRDEWEALSLHMDAVERWRTRLFQGSIMQLAGGTDASALVVAG